MKIPTTSFYIFICLFILSCKEAETMKEFKNDSFLVNYDESWEKSTLKNTTVFKAPLESKRDKFQENFNIIIQDFKQEGGIETFSKITVQSIEQFLGKKAIKEYSDIKLSGFKGKRIEYLMDKNPADQSFANLNIIQEWVVHNNKAYILTYTSQKDKTKKYLEVANKMFDSFSLN